MFTNQGKMFGVYFHRNLDQNIDMDSEHVNFKATKKGQKKH